MNIRRFKHLWLSDTSFIWWRH